MKPGDGRPRSNNRRMTCVVSCRFTPDELAKITKAAANDDYARPGLWMRDLAMEEAGRPGRVHRVLPALMGELHPIGVHLGQIASIARRTGQVPLHADLHHHMARMTDLFARMGQALP